jgi:hypothetical protein
MNSVRAIVIKLSKRSVTILIAGYDELGRIGPYVRINGLQTFCGYSRPPEGGDEDISNLFVFEILDGEDISSLKAGSVCEVTWD